MKIIVNQKELLRFRSECRKKYPREHLGALIGLRGSTGTLQITRIVDIPHTSTKWAIDYKDHAIQKSKTEAIQEGEEWLGTIHSHCYMQSDPTCDHLSETDIKTAIEFGETICGLVYVYARGARSSVSWHVPLPIPEVAYY